MIPTVMHIELNGVGAFCGAKRVGWPEECMSDEFARTLPICPDCENARREYFPRHTHTSVENLTMEQTEDTESKMKEIYLIDWKGYL